MVVIIGVGAYFALNKYVRVNFDDAKPEVSQEDSVKTAQTGEFSNGQKYTTYTADNFEVKYPDWLKADPKSTADQPNIKLVASNDNCGFIISENKIPTDESFKSSIEKRLAEQQSQTASGTTITFKDVQEKTAHVEADVASNKIIIKNISYAYLISGGQSVSIVFVAPKDLFENFCRPLIKEVLESVLVK